MTRSWRRYRLALALYCLLSAASQGIGWAQTLPSAKRQEEADIQEALRKIIAEDPAHAAEAQKALDALDKPESSAEGRQARNRRERGVRRIVNGLPSRSHPAVGALLKGDTTQTAGSWCTGTLVEDGACGSETLGAPLFPVPCSGARLAFVATLGVNGSQLYQRRTSAPEAAGDLSRDGGRL